MSGPDATPSADTVVVVGGGLAGITAALDLADAGRRVTLVERRRRLGGLTWSTRRGPWEIDNGQHVFLRCCDAYRAFLERIGSAGDVVLQDRLDITVCRPGDGPGDAPIVGRLRRDRLPGPLHLARSLLRYPHLTPAERLRVGLAAVPLRRLRPGDPALDDESFGSWLARHGQSARAVEALWDLVTVATVNLPAAEASLAMGVKVLRTGLLGRAGAADIGWSRVPLGRLHGERAAAALARAGVEVHLGRPVKAVTPTGGGWAVHGEDGATMVAGSVVVALPHREAAATVPPGSYPGQDRAADLGTSAIVDVHLVYDRPVTDLPLVAGIGSPVQWVFDRTASSGLDSPETGHQHSSATKGTEGDAIKGTKGSKGSKGNGTEGRSAGPQYLAVSLSAADDLLGERPDDLATRIAAELGRLLPAARTATLTDTFVTKERTATFRAAPGAGGLRPAPATRRPGLALAGAWTDTGWPATMEGAVRSGHAAAAAVLRAAPAVALAPRHRAAAATPVPEEVA